MMIRRELLLLPGACSLLGQPLPTFEPQNLSFPLDNIQGSVTPQDLFFARDHFREPKLSLSTWRLRIEGHVATPIELTLSDILALDVNIPVPRSRKQPFAQPKAVTFSTMGGGIGYLKVSVLPGLLGLDVAREIDAAIAALSGCDRLILDLRGHTGGGLGVLRLMSYLTPRSAQGTGNISQNVRELAAR